MGSAPSTLEVTAAGLVIVAGAFVFTRSPLVAPAQESSEDAKSSKKKKTKKGKKKAIDATPSIETRVDQSVDNKVILEPKILPSVATEDNSPTPSTSSKRRKTKASTRSKPPLRDPSSSSLRETTTTTTTTSSSVVDDDGWTKITGEKDESDLEQSTRNAIPDQQTLAERLLPKHAVTPVDDMLAEKPGGIARVIRVKAGDKPPSGFSWKDFDNVEQVDDDEETRQDEEEEGWGVVRSKTRSRPAGGASSTSSLAQAADTTKKQRQNTARREAQKAAKAEAERLRLAKLAQHRREAEQAKIAQQYASGGKGNISGGMKASVDSTGALIWE